MEDRQGFVQPQATQVSSPSETKTHWYSKSHESPTKPPEKTSAIRNPIFMVGWGLLSLGDGTKWKRHVLCHMWHAISKEQEMTHRDAPKKVCRTLFINKLMIPGKASFLPPFCHILGVTWHLLRVHHARAVPFTSLPWQLRKSPIKLQLKCDRCEAFY